jgi:hypothetical protein
VSAVIKPRGRKSVADLQADVGTLEHALAEAQRARDAARSARPRLLVEDDGPALAQNKRAGELAERDVTNLTANLEAVREALRIAQERDRGEARQEAYRAVQAQSTATRQAVEDLDKTIVAFVRAYRAARDSISKLDTTLVEHGLPAADPFLLKVKLQKLIERAMWLHSDGIFGEPHGMDSLDQLRANGRASLKLAAQELVTVTLRSVRSALGVQE